LAGRAAQICTPQPAPATGGNKTPLGGGAVGSGVASVLPSPPPPPKLATVLAKTTATVEEVSDGGDGHKREPDHAQEEDAARAFPPKGRGRRGSSLVRETCGLTSSKASRTGRVLAKPKCRVSSKTRASRSTSRTSNTIRNKFRSETPWSIRTGIRRVVGGHAPVGDALDTASALAASAVSWASWEAVDRLRPVPDADPSSPDGRDWRILLQQPSIRAGSPSGEMERTTMGDDGGNSGARRRRP
jgi:hypothetical protein